MASTTDLYSYLILAGGIFFLTIMFLNITSKGYLFKLMSVRMSRGKKKLIILKTTNGWYPTSGVEEEGSIVWKDRGTKLFNKNKVPKRAKCEPGMYYNVFGCEVVMITESDAKIIMPGNGQFVTGFDPILEEQLIMRALLRPTEEDKKMLLLIIILIVCIITFFFCLFLAYNLIKLQGLVVSLRGAIDLLRPNVVGGVVGGNVI